MNRWENSDYLLRTYSPLLQTGVLRVARFDFTASQVKTFGTNPIALFPAIPSYFYYPLNFTFYKDAGPVFTGVGTTLLPFFTATPQLNLQTILTTGVLDQLAASSISRSSGVGGVITDDQPANIGSKGISITTSGSVNFGGTGSPCHFVVNYFVIPNNISLIGGPSLPTV